MRSNGATDTVRISVEPELVLWAEFQCSERIAVYPAADHQLGKPRRSIRASPSREPAPQSPNVLGELAIDEISSIPADLPRRGIIGDEAIFIGMSEEEFAGRDGVSVGAVGSPARNDLPIPVGLGLGKAVGKTERLVADDSVGSPGAQELQARVHGCRNIIRLEPRYVGQRGKHDDKEVRFVRSEPPLPIRWRIGAYVSELRGLALVPRHSVEELGGKATDLAGIEPQSLES